MARLKRATPAGLPSHLLLKSNNSRKCFHKISDYVSFLWWLREYSEKYEVDIHAWALLHDHVSLFATPNIDFGLSKMVQALGRKYVRFFNSQNNQTGTLWEGRYKSSLVQPEKKVLEVYKFIELSPVRLFIVKNAKEYQLSLIHI